MLVATDPSKPPATQPDAPAVKGDVVLGAESRIVIEPIEEAAQVFYLLDIANNARVPVNPPAPFAFDLPKGAVGATIMADLHHIVDEDGTVREIAQPFAILRREHIQRPARRALGDRVEPLSLFQAARNLVVIAADDRDRLQRLYAFNDRVGVGAIAHEIAQHESGVERTSARVGKTGVERLEVRVNVGQDEVAHR